MFYGHQWQAETLETILYKPAKHINIVGKN